MRCAACRGLRCLYASVAAVVALVFAGVGFAGTLLKERERAEQRGGAGIPPEPLGRARFLHAAIERAEQAWREGPAHTYIQDLANRTLVHSHGWHPWAIVFIHVPRTGGDALETHLFPTDDIYRGGAWWGENHIPRFYDDLEKRGELNFTAPRRRPLYKGFVSGEDFSRLKSGPWKRHWGSVRTFTVLRDPVERVLSAVKHMRHNHVRICDNSVRAWLRAHSCSGLLMLEEKLQSYLHNAMAFQLGDHLNVTLRRRSPGAAAARAKALLRSLDFVGFYEDWQTDYYRLREAIFRDFDAQQDHDVGWLFGAWAHFRRWMFYLGTLVARPRLRTRKYAAQVSDPEEWRLLREVTYYDQQVYDYARKLAGRPRDPFYGSYGEFLLQEGLPALCVAVLGCLAMAIALPPCCRRLRCLGARSCCRIARGAPPKAEAHEL